MRSLAKILILGENQEILELQEEAFSKEGFESIYFKSLDEFEYDIREFHLVLVHKDSENSGFNFVEFIRQKDSHLPIILLAQSLSERELELAFNYDVDDCLVTPLTFKMLLYKIKVLLKRLYGINQQHLVYQSIFMDLNQRICMIHDVEINLTKLEFDLLSFFIQHKSLILEREYILESVWNDTSMKKRTINVNINRLSKKIDPENKENYFTAIRGIGYRFG